MALVCAAASCKISVKQGEISDVAFFPFPEDVELCHIWSIRSARYDLLGKSCSEVHATEYLCHLHFEENAFEKTSMGFILKTDAKPSLFSHDVSDFTAQVDERAAGLESRLFVRPEVATVHYGTSQEGVNIITFHVEVDQKENVDSNGISASPSGLHQLENGIYLEPGLFIHSKEQDANSNEFVSEVNTEGGDVAREEANEVEGVPVCLLEEKIEEQEQVVELSQITVPDLSVDQLQTMTVNQIQAFTTDVGQVAGKDDGTAIINVEQLCRVCANKHDKLVPVFEEQGIKIQLLEKILMHLPIQVKENEQLPNKVCYKCVSQLNSWHDVVTTCVMADRRLRRMFGVPDITEREVQLLAEDKRTHEVPDHQIEKTVELIKKEWAPVEELVETVLTISDTPSDADVSEVREGESNLSENQVTVRNDLVCCRKYQVSKVVDVCVESMDPREDTKTSFRMELCRDVEKNHSESGNEDGSENRDLAVWECKICGHVADSVSSLLTHEQSNHCSVQLGCRFCDMVFDSSVSQSNHECNDSKKLQDVCEQQGTNWTSLWAARVSSGSKLPAKFICDTCNKGFNLKKALREHLLRVHCAESPFKCSLCHKQYGSPTSLDIHMATHSTETPYLCDKCGKSFKHITNLRGHKRSHLTSAMKNRHICRLCNARFRSRFHLFEHLNVHEGKKPYSCQVCQKTFSKKIQLRQHNFAHSDAQPYKCHVCGAGFNRRGNMTQHVKRHFRENKFTCKVCNIKFTTLGAVLNHRKTHSQQEVELSIKNSLDDFNLEEEYKCKVCERLFAKKESLSSHMRTHTGEKLFECSICGKKLSNKSSLKYHERSFHTGERPFVCQFCNEGFISKESQLIHERTHTGEKPFKCEVCEAAFRCGSNLYQHMKVHANTRQFQCQTCGKQFQRKGALNVHLRVHTGERPFECDLCERKFSQKNDMLKHRQTHFKDGVRTRTRAVRKAAVTELEKCGQKQVKSDTTIPSQTSVMHLTVDNPTPTTVNVDAGNIAPMTITPMNIAQPLLITHDALMAECAISMPISENTHSLILQTY